METVVHYKPGTYLPITENWIYTQIRNLNKYKPIVYTDKVQNLDLFPVDNIRIKLNEPFIVQKAINKIPLFKYRFYRQWLKADRPSIVHAHFGPAGYEFVKLRKVSTFPIVTTFYGYDLSLLPKINFQWLKKYSHLFRAGDCFLVEGNYMKGKLSALGCPSKKISVHHLGIDMEKIKFIPRKIDSHQTIKILVAGRFVEKKGIPYAIKAFHKILTIHPEKKIQMTIIGDSSGSQREEKEKKHILDLVKSNSLQPFVKFLGFKTHNELLWEAMSHHIFLSPSTVAEDGDSEGGAPVSIIEMQATGLPIVSTLHCDIPEVVRNGESGFLVPEKNVDALVNRLEWLVQHPEAWGVIGEKGRQHVQREYNAKIQGVRLENIYENTIREGTSGRSTNESK